MGETCSVCGVTVTGSDVLYAPDGGVVCPTHFAALDPAAAGASPPWRMSAIAGGIAGAIPFAVTMSSTSMSTMNGQVTSFVYRDWIAVICGVIAATLGVITIVAARKEQLRRAVAFAAGLGVLALGGMQIARGFGVFETPSGTNAGISESSEPMTAPEATPTEPAPAPTKTVECADANACMELAQARREAKDGAAALAAFERACEKGSPDGCDTAAYWHAAKPEWSKAIPLYQRGCELGKLNSCSELGYAVAYGNGVEKDVAKANEIYDKACTSGHAFSCVRLGLHYYDGKGVKKDLKRALALFVKGCDIGKDDASSGTGCHRAAEQLASGEGVKKRDKKRAAAYAAKACERDPEYCPKSK